MTEIIKNAYAKVNRNLDGKGRLILPRDLREAAGWMPDEPVEVGLIEINGKAGLLITAAFREVGQHGRDETNCNL